MRRTRTTTSARPCGRWTAAYSKAAIAAAVTAGYRPGDLEAIGITASPCGGCRQWLFEFRLERVTFANTHGEIVSYRPEDLLPETWELPG